MAADWSGTGERRGAEIRPDKVQPGVLRAAAGSGSRAGDLGIYAAVMLFEGWEIQFSDAWQNHPFNAANNVNGVEGAARQSGIQHDAGRRWGGGFWTCSRPMSAR